MTNAEYQAHRARDRKARGICVRCLTPARPDRTLCARCARGGYARTAKRRKRLVADGRCVNCGGSRAGSRTLLCPLCTARHALCPSQRRKAA